MCGQEFKCDHQGRKFCSQKCMGKYYSLHPHFPKKKKIKLVCEVCGKEFWVLPSSLRWINRQTCSRKCQGLLRRKRVIKICKNCGEKFEVRDCETKGAHRGKFCSLKCRYEFMVGKNAPVPLNRVKINCETCGKEFEVSKSEKNIARFCSRSCLGKWNVLYNIKRQRPTSLEKGVKGMMESLDLEFEMEKRIKPFIVDFFVKPNFIIEADGNYWHRDEKKDKRRDTKLKSLGYQVLHLPEDLIKQDAQSCKNHILAFTKDLTK